MSFRLCPRCGEKTLNTEQVLNALSRRDNKTYICNRCGDDEALIDGGYKAVDVTERRFVERTSKPKPAVLRNNAGIIDD